MSSRPRTRLALAKAGAIAMLSALVLATAGEARADTEFATWLAGLRAEAQARGVRPQTLDRALAGVAPIPRVIELDRFQPEFTQTFWAYLDQRVNDARIQRGRDLLVQHRELLGRIEARFGVPARILVAFWALESNFGDHTGSFPVVGALATLAYDQRRAAFFRAQLLAALAGMDRGDIPFDAKASWAGAMGQTQFMPETYRMYALDFDADGRRDLWRSLPDIFGSSANYLERLGWQRDQTWGREVRLPEGFDAAETGFAVKKPLAEWARLGVRRADGQPLSDSVIEASIVLPAGWGGPAFAVYPNFRIIMNWNASILYALSVGVLADRMTGANGLAAPRPAAERPLARHEIEEIQRRLAERGFAPGPADGIVGPATREAIRAFQLQARLPADGFPTADLLDRLRGA